MSIDEVLNDSAGYARQAEEVLDNSRDHAKEDGHRDRLTAQAQVYATLSMAAAVRELIEVYVAATAGQ